ncbi:coiled-coil domain-containing protein [Mucisphaera calidilacus]|uniref:Uncharacterized protein n=1 Tax=Mucisphaera calidilacus TaxID=2527982 RepID=A0A518BZJ0_9BACT|nr:hypothetical protein [Mucisphaera calidilacus]QDU72392.1 hypothetical protein Pan265_22570 [Mucisphaera calidilacus]
MTSVRRILDRAHRRVWLIDAVTRLGGLLVVAGVISLVLIVVDRRTSLVVLPWIHGVGPVCALLIAGFVAWVMRPSSDELARRLDDRLSLQDRLATSMYLQAAGVSERPFAAQVIGEADRVAAGQPIGRAFPWRLGVGWRVLPVVLVAVGLSVWLVPAAVIAEPEGGPVAADANEEPTEEERAEDVETARLLSEIREGDAAEDAARRDELITRVAELAEVGLNNPELREEAEAVVSDLEQDLAAAEERESRQAESLANDLSRLELPDAGEAVELAEALRRGDFKQAVEALREMEEKLANQEMSEERRAQLAEQMEDLAEQLEAMAERQQERSEMAAGEFEEMLEQAGFSSEQIEEMREQNFDAETMQRMAVEQLAEQMRREGESMEEARERAERVAQQMAEAAKEAMDQAQQQSENSNSTDGMADAMRRLSQAIKQAEGGESGAAAGAQQQARQMGGSQSRAGQLARDRRKVQDALSRLGQYEGEDGPSGTGSGAGYGEGGEVLGPDQTEVAGYETDVTDDRQSLEPGRVITSWGPGGGPTEATSRLRFDATVDEARDAAERAVAEDRVPRRYHRSIQRYFEQLPQQAPAETVDP